MCSIDWQTTFDQVNWARLMQILKGTGIDWSQRLIGEFYTDQNVKLKLDQS
jgi:hypothetical protein